MPKPEILNPHLNPTIQKAPILRWVKKNCDAMQKKA